MTITLDWLGCATFRLVVDDLVVFLDAYLDRPAPAPPVGLTAAEVDRADFILVGHSHWDHLWGAETIAHNTGATIVGSYESVRVMHDQEQIPDAQLMPVSGGERIRLSADVTVRVFPSIHSCIWSKRGAAPIDEVCIGEYGMTLQEQREQLAARMARLQSDQATPPPWAGQRPRGDGGALVYLIDTPEGSIFWQDTMGHWTGVMRDIRPDVALLAAAGRGNIDGDPVQGSAAQFIAREAELLQPRRIVLNHHDDFAGRGRPHFTDATPIREELSHRAPRTELVEMGYKEAVPILDGLRRTSSSQRVSVSAV
ncbi:MAG: MBL fold metallo-hydrolase [Chloroflexi bacterium]|nr:MBL fold metallo-hydrolase [Chloroflexota bacterium]